MKWTRPSFHKAVKALFALAPLLCCLALVGLVLAQISTNFDQSWHVLSGAGAPVSSTNFAVDGSLSQLAVGIAQGGNYRVESGYWYGPITCIVFGDLDCNCEVEADDIQQVACRWRAKEGDPEYASYPYYDLNHDGVINVVDLMLVAAHWGESCGP
jgi:hypothetical protein